MTSTSARLSLGFSCAGHTYSHLFGPIFYVAALTLEKEWALSHGEVIGLIVVGNVLFGVAAPLAGWLGDRWSAAGMMAVFFLGTGMAMIATGVAVTPAQVGLALAATGLFASIYHPVGIAWLVRNAENRGTALGINGIFGGVGPALAALAAGLLVDLSSWRAAFLAPGTLVVLTGVAFCWLLWRRTIIETKVDRRPEPPASRQDMVRAFIVLTITMLGSGLVYQATQPALPKVFSERVEGLGDGVIGVGFAVAIVYFVAGAMQYVAGRLADRYPLKTVYVVAFTLQVPVLLLAAAVGGPSLLAVSALMVSFNVGALPAENSLVARYSPSRWRGLAYGLKFILALGLSGLGAKLEGVVYDLTGGFFWLFVLLAGVATVAASAALLLPAEREGSAAVPATEGAAE